MTSSSATALGTPRRGSPTGAQGRPSRGGLAHRVGERASSWKRFPAKPLADRVTLGPRGACSRSSRGLSSAGVSGVATP